MKKCTLYTSEGIQVTDGCTISVVPEKIRAYIEKASCVNEETVAKYCDWHGENYFPVEITVNSPEFPAGNILVEDSSGGKRKYKLQDGKCTVTNMLLGADYTVILEETGEKTHFSTLPDGPRMIRIEGTNNTRDIGGRILPDGKHRIRQGMIYRGARMREIPEAGLRTLSDELKIKTELDLTGGGESSEAVGEIMAREFHSIRWYQLIFQGEKDYEDALRDALLLFTDRKNYPFYYHCSLGRDRTGTITAILEALCGADKEYVLKEHFLSFFSLRGDGENAGLPAHFANMRALFAGFDAILGPEHTLKENVEAFLRKIGLTDDDFGKIRSVLME